MGRQLSPFLKSLRHGVTSSISSSLKPEPHLPTNHIQVLWFLFRNRLWLLWIAILDWPIYEFSSRCQDTLQPARNVGFWIILIVTPHPVYTSKTSYYPKGMGYLVDGIHHANDSYSSLTILRRLSQNSGLDLSPTSPWLEGCTCRYKVDAATLLAIWP